jgi:hypothetical protein
LAEQLAAKDRVCYTAIKLGLKRKLKEWNCEYQ